MQDETRGTFFTELLKFILIAVVVVVPIRMFIAQPFIVSGASMEPTFDTGQYLIIDELSYRLSAPERGDVIIFRYPKNPSIFYIKRIIGLPNETLAITNETVTITRTDGTTEVLKESYVRPGNAFIQTVTLGEDDYFVMGDNRPDSSDSRIWGAVSRDLIIGRAFLRLLPITQIGTFPGDTRGTYTSSNL